ncbi:hypothetical protein D915_003896 [Fasciola hepatica]|uniref:Uncharacterized protein n=1 Tax=Fasciola hepatica TaxID=6192 RepID=A0A4E0RGS2_FASHE|nr:hypothetical protein D915_003896 [Fasciola hepatica]
MPAVRPMKSQPAKNGSSKAYAKIISDLNDEMDQLVRQNRTLSENLSRLENRISSESNKEFELEQQNKSLLDELCRLNKENVSSKADFRRQIDGLIADNNRLHLELAQAVKQQEDIRLQMKQAEQVTKNHFISLFPCQTKE